MNMKKPLTPYEAGYRYVVEMNGQGSTSRNPYSDPRNMNDWTRGFYKAKSDKVGDYFIKKV